jgi:hypothetical protein
MKQVKILVNNIGDENHRGHFEKEINGYLRIGWQIISTHQNADTLDGNKVLMLTVVLQNPIAH